MKRRFMGAALVAAWLAGSSGVQAQYLPVQDRGGHMPEPVPFGVPPMPFMPQGQLPPGPPPANLPDVGPAGVSLPANLPTAWDEDKYEGKPAFYAYVGAIALQRQRLGHAPVALVDPSGVDTGAAAPARAATAGDFDDLSPNFAWGVRGTLGFHWSTYAVEASGFYIGEQSTSETLARRGQLNTFFVNAPLGFEGNNNLFRQADLVRTSVETRLGSAELNFRSWVGLESDLSFLVGVRYLDIQDRFGLFVDDEGLTVRDLDNRPDPTRQAQFFVRANNRLVAPQLGFEWNKPVCTWLAFTMTGKGAWGANFVETDALLVRGDGRVGRAVNGDSDTIFSHMYELGFFLNVSISQQIRFRGGWDLFWAVDVVEGVDQFSYDLQNPLRSRRNEDGSIFYHGPVLELQVVF